MGCLKIKLIKLLSRSLLSIFYLLDCDMPKSDPIASDSSQSSPATAAPTEQPGFGWTTYAERINGRFAMVGFLALLLLEFFTRQDFFTWIGLS